MGNQQTSDSEAGHSSGEVQPTSWSLFSPGEVPSGEVRTNAFLCLNTLQPVYLHVYAFPSDESKVLSFAEKVGLGAYHSGTKKTFVLF